MRLAAVLPDAASSLMDHAIACEPSPWCRSKSRMAACVRPWSLAAWAMAMWTLLSQQKPDGSRSAQ